VHLFSIVALLVCLWYSNFVVIITESTKIPDLTFSWKRAIGITQAKQRIARATGIPMTKQGFERKIGNTILKGAKK
jgi:hypothetical protein